MLKLSNGDALENQSMERAMILLLQWKELLFYYKNTVIQLVF